MPRVWQERFFLSITIILWFFVSGKFFLRLYDSAQTVEIGDNCYIIYTGSYSKALFDSLEIHKAINLPTGVIIYGQAVTEIFYYGTGYESISLFQQYVEGVQVVEISGKINSVDNGQRENYARINLNPFIFNQSQGRFGKIVPLHPQI